MDPIRLVYARKKEPQIQSFSSVAFNCSYGAYTVRLPSLPLQPWLFVVPAWFIFCLLGYSIPDMLQSAVGSHCYSFATMHQAFDINNSTFEMICCKIRWNQGHDLRMQNIAN